MRPLENEPRARRRSWGAPASRWVARGTPMPERLTLDAIRRLSAAGRHGSRPQAASVAERSARPVGLICSSIGQRCGSLGLFCSTRSKPCRNGARGDEQAPPMVLLASRRWHGPRWRALPRAVTNRAFLSPHPTLSRRAEDERLASPGGGYERLASPGGRGDLGRRSMTVGSIVTLPSQAHSEVRRSPTSACCQAHVRSEVPSAWPGNRAGSCRNNAERHGRNTSNR